MRKKGKKKKKNMKRELQTLLTEEERNRKTENEHLRLNSLNDCISFLSFFFFVFLFFVAVLFGRRNTREINYYKMQIKVV